MNPSTIILYFALPITALCTCTALTFYLPRRFTDSSSIAKIRLITTLLVATATVAMATALGFFNYLAALLLGLSTASFSQPLTLAGALLIAANLIFLYNFWTRWVFIPVRDFGQISYGIAQAQKKKERRREA